MGAIVPRRSARGLTRLDIFLTLLAMTSSTTLASDSPRAGQAQVQGEVPGTYVRLLYDYLRQLGHDPVSILARQEPVAQQIERVSIVTWRGLLERAAAFLEDPLLGLHLGQHVTPAHFGVMGYVLLACENLGAALQRMETFHRLLYDVNPLQLRLESKTMVLEWAAERGRPGALVDETAISALVQIGRDITASGLGPSLIRFINPPPADTQAYVEYFGCPVHFAQPVTQAVFPADYLALPLRAPDAALLALLESQAERLLASLPAVDELEPQVRRAVAQLAPAGAHSLDNVAQVLHVSPRTLHRRLQGRGVNFRRVRDDTLSRIAQDHLADPHLQLADVALLLGYSEQSAFNRAFRRWTGQTPRQCRLGASSAGNLPRQG